MKTKTKIIIVVIVVFVWVPLIIVPIRFYNRHHAADYWWEPQTSWLCDDPEIHIDFREEESDYGYIVVDGKKTEFRVGILYSEACFLYTKDDGTTGTCLGAEVIPHLFSDDVTLEVYHSEISGVNKGDKFVLHKVND